MTPSPIAGRAASGVVLAALLTLVLLALGELLLVPTDAMARSAADVIAIFALSARGHLSLLAPLLVMHGFLAVMTGLALSSPRLGRGWATVLALAASLGLALASHEVLVAYAPFRGHVPFLAAWTLLGVYLAASYLAMVRDGLRGGRIILMLVGLGGAGMATWVNATKFAGEYPALHQALATVMYLLCHAGLVLAFSLRAPRTRTAWSGWRSSTVAALALLGLALGSILASARATTLYRSYTTVGNRTSSGGGAWRAVRCERVIDDLTLEEARAVFARHSHLPALPDAFSLADYNVLLVTIETTRFDETSLSGRVDATPQLARIVADGAYSFLDALAPSSTTLQSMSSLFSLRFPSMVSMQTYTPLWSGWLLEEADTVAELFQRSGYATFAALHALIPRVTRGLGQGFDDVRQMQGGLKRPFEDEDVANWTINVLDQKRASGERFFGWVFLTSPHEPYFERTPKTSDRRTRYRQEIAHADAQLGRIYDHLRATNMLERTVLIVLADHGEEFGEHGGQSHGRTLHREVLHVPAVVAVPGVTGAPVRALTSTLYLFPWLLLTGDDEMRAAAETVVRDDLGPLMKALDGAVIAELMGWDRQHAALVWPAHKLIQDVLSDRVEVYDRTHDFDEHRDLGDQAHALEAALATKLHAYRALRACRQRARMTPAVFVAEPTP